MSGKRLSELPAAEAVGEDARLYVVQGGQSLAMPPAVLLSQYRRRTDGTLETIDFGDITDAVLELDGSAQAFTANLIGNGVLTLVAPVSGVVDVRLDLTSDNGLRVFAWSSLVPILWLYGVPGDNQPPATGGLRRYYLSANPSAIVASWADYQVVTP
jgi:hypothetical protein